MKHIKVYIGMIAGLLAMLTSCSDSVMNDLPSQNNQENGMTVDFNIAIPSFEQNTSRSVTFGTNEGIESKNNVLLFCFDNEGQFVGLGNIQDMETIKKDQGGFNSPYQSGGDIKQDGSTDQKKITAKLPSATSRIHMVANANEQYKSIDMSNQADWQGMHENTLMTTFETEYGENQAQMTRYWGYVKRDNPEELQKFLNDKTKQHILHLIRDRAKISAEWADKSRTDKITITVINGQAYGTLAPFDRNELKFPDTTGDDKWIWNIDYITPSISTKRLKGDVGQMKNPTYTFENRNLPTDPMKVIISVNNGKKYLLYLQDSKNKPYIIKRNYEYKIVIEKLDESLGYNNLEEALKGAPINNPWIKVEEIVPDISDGTYSMSIVGGTYKMLNAGSGKQQVQFTYSGDANMTAEDFDVSWIKNEQYATDAQPKLTYSYDADKKMGTGTITYTLNTIDNVLREGTIHVIDTKHGLNRNFHLFSIREFDYQIKTPQYIGKNPEDTETLTLTIPANYPEAFLPVQIKIASNDVNLKDGTVEVGDTQEETGNSWNCWMVYKAHTTGKHTLTLKNLRTATRGSQGCFYIKADNMNQGKAKKYTFTYR